jgi:ATP-dependent Clp protease adaptor protein ClpS
MMHIHSTGVGVVGVYTFAIAETKVAQVMATADRADLPLLCTMEPEDGAEIDE